MVHAAVRHLLGSLPARVKSPTASREASIGENCDPEEEGILGGMTTPARITLGGSYAAEQAGLGEFSPLSVTRVQSPRAAESKTRRPPP